MGLLGEIEAEAEKVERALIADIVRMLPLVPDQLAYWWVCHAGPLNCGPDKATVEKDLLLKHHHKK